MILNVRQENMKTWQKVSLAIVVVAILGAGAFAFAAYRYVTKTIPDLYAQWASAEMVIAFRKEKGRMPIDWDEMAPFYGTNSPHHGGLTFEEVRGRISIDFPDLPKLESDYAKSAAPEIISTTSGIQSHWDGAEPNQLVIQELRK
jgi:hypothetical protein